MPTQAQNTPQHVAIMDGNGRWAQKRFMPRTAGHAKGAAGVKALVEHCARHGVKYLTLFAFSTENWQRTADEVSTLMGLFVQYLEKEMKSLADAGVRLKVVGDVAGFGAELQQRIHAASRRPNTISTLPCAWLPTMVAAGTCCKPVKNWQAAHPQQSVEGLTEATLAQHLSTANMPEVDLLIRTGGEQRISNFLLWQSAYAELYFSDVLWPEFDRKELEKALNWYSQRRQRFGKTMEQVIVESLSVWVA